MEYEIIDEPREADRGGDAWIIGGGTRPHPAMEPEGEDELEQADEALHIPEAAPELQAA